MPPQFRIVHYRGYTLVQSTQYGVIDVFARDEHVTSASGWAEALDMVDDWLNAK